MSGSINEAEGLRPQRDPSAFLRLTHHYCVALAGFALLFGMLATLDGVGESASSTTWDAPGLTLDEIFNIQAGEYLVESLVIHGPGVLTPDGVRQVFGDRRYNPDHPPLARFWIGLWHAILRGSPDVEGPPPRYSVQAARYACAAIFVLTIGLVGRFTARWYGRGAGWVAAISLVLMPRVFGHGHLAALETAIGSMFAATVLYIADRWHAPGLSRSLQTACSDRLQPVAWKPVVVAGVLLGLALLTKIQAILLPIPIGLWALWRWRWRAIPLLLVFGLVGVAVFFLGWPWLWLDPIGHTLQYLGRTTDRPTLYCYYLGLRYADVDVPWHYSFVMFLTTVPVGLHILGFWGLWRTVLAKWTAHGVCLLRSRHASRACPLAVDREQSVGWAVPTSAGGQSPPYVAPASDPDAGRIGHDPRITLIAGVMLFVLTFFALPGITIYDGERLFLVVFPLWAVLIGIGARRLWDAGCSDQRTIAAAAKPRRTIAIALLIAGLGEGLWGLVSLHPCQLSYYNLAVGGLGGADRLGFEPTYWRDSVTRKFLEEVAAAVPPKSTLYVAPVLHPANRIDLALLSPVLQQHGLSTDSYDDKDPAKRDMRYVLVFRRHADPWDSLVPAPAGAKLLCEVRRQEVQLAACYELPAE